jgi:hypothetical protein
MGTAMAYNLMNDLYIITSLKVLSIHRLLDIGLSSSFNFQFKFETMLRGNGMLLFVTFYQLHFEWTQTALFLILGVIISVLKETKSTLKPNFSTGNPNP